MEDCSSSISAFCTQLRSNCGHLEASCAALRSVVDQRPSSVPAPNLPSLLTTLINRVSSTSQSVRNLESKTTETISFQELLGHCMEIYKQNEASICTLEDRLKEFGYTPGDFTNGNLNEPEPPYVLSSLEANPEPSTSNSAVGEMVAVVSDAKKSSAMYSQKDEKFYGGSATGGDHFGSFYPGTLSLEDLGLSAAGLACLAQEESSPAVDYSTPLKSVGVKQEADWSALSVDSAAVYDEDIEPCTPPHYTALLRPVEEEEYSSCPTWLKMQISYEDLNTIVDSMCEILAKKAYGGNRQFSGTENFTLDQEDISVLSAAGTKMKPCLLFLVRLGRLRTGHESGATVYHVVHG